MEKSRLKRSRVNPLSESETWKVKLIEEVSLTLSGHLEMEFDSSHLEEILTFICTE